MNKKFTAASGTALMILCGSLSVYAHDVCEQTPSPKNLDNLVIVVDPKPTQRAFNFARMRAESLNGGISRYQPQSCMYSHQSSRQCLISDQNGFTYRFLGGSPGWETLNLPPTIETEIRVFSDGKTKAEIIYNGFPR